ncbi:hypothetical protein [Glaciecola sp. SC05]|uniref:hypothetical protein n=1 Tax=Glaciecola sp. SC05 TaxID=1987355 RepID=UPI0035270771
MLILLAANVKFMLNCGEDIPQPNNSSITTSGESKYQVNNAYLSVDAKTELS